LCDEQFSIQEAADYLNIHHTSLLKLLEKGEIPLTIAEEKTYIRLSHLMAYNKRRREGQSKALEIIARICEDAGIYD
jgi:excisionase family DNA binding protein